MPSLRERDGKLIENWYVACLSKELPRKKIIQRIVYDAPIALFRDQNGRPSALADRCLHRHAQISQGAWLDGCVGCPYHGWVYDPQGKVVEIPSEGPDQTCKEKERHLRSYPTVEQDEMIWVWMGEGAPRTATPPFRLPHQDNSKWVSYFMITDFDNEVTHLAENFMDVPHTIFVHSGWFRNAAKKCVPISVETKDGSVLVTYDQPNDSIGFTSRILNPSGEPMRHTDHFFMPNLTRVDYTFGENGFVIISQCTPVSAFKCRVYTAIIYRIGALTAPLKPFMRFYTRRVIEQDVDIMINQGQSLARNLEWKFQGTDADEVHRAIERLRDLGVAGDPSVWSVREKTERDIWI